MLLKQISFLLPWNTINATGMSFIGFKQKNIINFDN